MASINDLDNPLLVLILNRLCIQKLFTAGHVCVRWNAIRGLSAHERKELVLMVGSDAKHYIEQSAFQIPKQSELVDENGNALFPENDQSHVQLQIYSFPLDFVRLLLTHFTNLTTLTISTRVYSKELDSIIHLLEQFNRPNGTLHTLKLYSAYDQKDQRITELDKNHIRNIRTCLRLLSAVNSIGSLRRLTFDVNAKFVKNENYPRIDLSILAQLELFEFNSADAFDCLDDSIMKYAVNNQGLRRIGIQYVIDDYIWMLDLSTEFASRFTYLHLFFNLAHYENLCRHFSQLTTLEIDFHQDAFTIFTLFRPLTHLPNLLSLTVFISGEILDNSTVPHNERGTVHFELPSVKVFNIYISTRTNNHNFLHKCNLNRLFPNVQVVRVIRAQSPCWKCYSNIDERTHSEDVLALEQHCALYMFKHFTNAQHLRIVWTEDVDDSTRDVRCMEWIWNELKPFEDEDEEEEEEE